MPAADSIAGPGDQPYRGVPSPLYGPDDPETPIGVIIENSIPRSGGWFVAATFLLQDDQLVLSELRVFPGTDRRRHGLLHRPGEWSREKEALDPLPAGGITARLLREVSVADITARAHSWLRAIAEHTSDRPGGRRHWSKVLSAEAAKPARAGRSDRYYAIWAARYVDKLGSARPVQELADEWGLTPTQVRDLIYKARARKLLSGGPPGKPGGTLTDLGREALDRGEKS